MRSLLPAPCAAAAVPAMSTAPLASSGLVILLTSTKEILCVTPVGASTWMDRHLPLVSILHVAGTYLEASPTPPAPGLPSGKVGRPEAKSSSGAAACTPTPIACSSAAASSSRPKASSSPGPASSGVGALACRLPSIFTAEELAGDLASPSSSPAAEARGEGGSSPPRSAGTPGTIPWARRFRRVSMVGTADLYHFGGSGVPSPVRRLMDSSAAFWRWAMVAMASLSSRSRWPATRRSSANSSSNSSRTLSATC
mmetsp:Transcript_67064/g.162128  ORF Transcript_67064/g.162128 Transcript_67064/m.162128 type:complete len:254 (+) Transcript_67064:3-764(+)